MRHSLKYRMAVATAVAVTLILVARAGFSQYYAYESLKEMLQAQQDTLVKLVAGQLDEKLESREVVLRRLARALTPALNQKPSELRRIATETVDMPESFNAVFLAWPDGTLAFSTAVPEGVKMTVGERDYFKEIQRGASFAVSDLLQGKHSSSPGVILAIPLRGPDGELRGVVGGVLNLSASNFLRELAHSRVGVTGYYCLVSAGANPRYALHPDGDKVLAPARAVGEACGADQPESNWEMLFPEQPVVARYLLSSNGWEVVSVLPADEAYGPLLEIRQRAVGIGLASLLIAAVLMWSVVRRLLAPLEHLHRAVRQLATQPAAVSDLPVGRDDEIGELAASFAEVMHQLSEREAALKAAKDSAAASEKRIEAIANHVPDFVAFIDAAERFAFVNQAYARHFGLPAEQITGLSLRELWGTPEYVANKPYLDQARDGHAVTFTRESTEGTAWEVTYQPAWDDAQDAVTGLHMFARNVTGERQKLRSLEAQTLSDHLTGLLNRKGFDRRLTETMARADAAGQRAALLLVDLDDFKAVNDTHGHPVGDRLLVAFAERLTACVRKGDAVARIGGDEFAIILDNVSQAGTVERIAHTVVQAALRPFSINGHTLVSTASVGSAIHRPDNGTSVSELFMRADMSLYEAKRRGKARYAAAATATTSEA
ncbi:PAS domain S-box-containing protein/diguanylate cyclase (GGDEF) domain-containing protein [Cupriavidus sp. YR651]|uniref:sensor domain-containing diguanylate cyclase n=1 Tax=Cupriavidus sp. YR651 TaxID=1855315 RepID=UPI00088112FE|nr:diguanylate cyclase [Cupriavidus sp. YR651]SDC10763.1 PAS domain S-box-containing protein/diguanylate cyclase (GGDEF) domain-containing protein [Cupriavidus sp. YR651]